MPGRHVVSSATGTRRGSPVGADCRPSATRHPPDLVVCLQNNLLCPASHRRPSLRSASSMYRCGYTFVGGPCDEHRWRRMPQRHFTDRPQIDCGSDSGRGLDLDPRVVQPVDVGHLVEQRNPVQCGGVTQSHHVHQQRVVDGGGLQVGVPEVELVRDGQGRLDADRRVHPRERGSTDRRRPSGSNRTRTR